MTSARTIKPSSLVVGDSQRAAERIISLAFRTADGPATTRLWALTSYGNIVAVNLATAEFAGTPIINRMPINGTAFGFGFDPTSTVNMLLVKKHKVIKWAIGLATLWYHGGT